MASQSLQEYNRNADVYYGSVAGKQKALQLLEEFSLPKGLLPIDEVLEVGFNRATGFIWMKLRKRRDHKFRRIGRTVSYDAEVTAFVENRRMRRLTGVKCKELMWRVPISDIYIGDKDSSKITFATPTGLSQSYPISAFEVEESEK